MEHEKCRKYDQGQIRLWVVFCAVCVVCCVVCRVLYVCVVLCVLDCVLFVSGLKWQMVFGELLVVYESNRRKGENTELTSSHRLNKQKIEEKNKIHFYISGSARLRNDKTVFNLRGSHEILCQF